MRPKIRILYTGGTLGMNSSSGGELIPGEAMADLSRWVPELDDLAEIDIEIVTNIDSSLLTPEIWLRLAHRIRDAQNNEDIKGLVILHGTDTLAYTSSMLSFLIPDLQIPVVLTGSQKPLQIVRTDARNNVIGAVESSVLGPVEVMVFFRDYAFRGNRCTKSAISHFRAFDSPNFPALGRAGIRWEWREKDFWPQTRRPSIWPELPPSFPSTPLVIPWIPGFDLDSLRASLNNNWALIIEAFGAGNIPLVPETVQLLQQFEKDGGIIAIRSQVPKGEVEMDLYAPGKRLLELGVINAADMTREALVTKLMALKAQGLSTRDIKHQLGRSIAGEMREMIS